MSRKIVLFNGTDASGNFGLWACNPPDHTITNADGGNAMKAGKVLLLSLTVAATSAAFGSLEAQV